MKTHIISRPQYSANFLFLALSVVAWAWPTYLSSAQTAGDPAMEMQQVIQLSQAHIDDGIIITHIQNSHASFNLSVQDILNLSRQGVSQNVLQVMMKQSSVATPSTSVPPAAPPKVIAGTPPATMSNPAGDGNNFSASGETSGAGQVATGEDSDDGVNIDYFKEKLNAYGNWQEVPTNGVCWIPAELNTNANWRPYVDHGSWTYTSDGWTWQSDYPWGEVVFHYGRWFQDVTVHWAWTPGYQWAPAWVAWRGAQPVPGSDPGAVGWAPLPPQATYEDGVGLEYDGAVPEPSEDFGLPATAFVYVNAGDFWSADMGAVAINDPVRLNALYVSSIPENHYGYRSGHFVMSGLGPQKMAVLTHHGFRVQTAQIHDLRILHARLRQYDHFGQLHRQIIQEHGPIHVGERVTVQPGGRVSIQPGPGNHARETYWGDSQHSGASPRNSGWDEGRVSNSHQNNSSLDSPTPSRQFNPMGGRMVTGSQIPAPARPAAPAPAKAPSKKN